MRGLLALVVCWGWGGLVFGQPPVFVSPAASGGDQQTVITQLAGVFRQAAKDRRQLTERLQELAALQTEIARLRMATDTPSNEQVLFEVVVLELSRTKLNELRQAASKEVQTSQEPQEVSLPDSELVENLEKWEKQKVIKVLATPRALVQSGQPASYHAGERVSVQIPDGSGGMKTTYKNGGTEVDCLLTVRDDGILHIEAHPRRSSIGESRNVTVEGVSVSIPPAHAMIEVGTTFDIQSGQTMVLRSLVETRTVKSLWRESQEEIELIFLFTATRVATELGPESPADAKPVQAVSAPVHGLPR